MRLLKNESSGFIIPALLSLMVALSIITASVVILIDSNFTLVGRNIQSQQAFNIAEAGLNYYLWHLSHNATDYKDGGTTPASPTTYGYGPYVHNYVDASDKIQGTFTLYINPVGSGSSVVKVRSIGQVNGTNFARTVEAQIGAPSFASYAILSDSALWFGKNEVADGPVHSNQGIRMDGSSNADITSANATYLPTNSLGGDGNSHPGVWCDISVISPVNCNTRPKTDWRYPVPTIDFNQVSGTLCTVKKAAFASDPSTASLATQANACSQTPGTRTNAYIPQRSSSANDSRGYYINLNSNSTYDLYTVNNVKDIMTDYSSALSPTLVASNIAVPASGVIFAEDNVWVRAGTTFAGRLTLASGRLATSVTTNLTVVDNIKYSTKNGNDAIGLMAEGDIWIAPYAPPTTSSFTFEVDAAVIAGSGDVVYPSNYTFSNTTCTRGWISPNQKLLFYGSIAVRQTWTWSWQWNSSCGDNVYDSSTGYYISGFKYNTTQYDYNLLYNPPPSWPITSSYNFLSWREVLVTP
ncbi:MAG: hypothetical protein JWO47_799 [Candidatus Saccharibacteria bacterium]|nr:hypothetical protein [Candidatus Saccharibacteria bacterium]